jgi:hypothetical protein
MCASGDFVNEATVSLRLERSAEPESAPILTTSRVSNCSLDATQPTFDGKTIQVLASCTQPYQRLLTCKSRGLLLSTQQNKTAL